VPRVCRARIYQDQFNHQQLGRYAYMEPPPGMGPRPPRPPPEDTTVQDAGPAGGGDEPVESAQVASGDSIPVRAVPVEPIRRSTECCSSTTCTICQYLIYADATSTHYHHSFHSECWDNLVAASIRGRRRLMCPDCRADIHPDQLGHQQLGRYAYMEPRH
jgi:hypothetical protein